MNDLGEQKGQGHGPRRRLRFLRVRRDSEAGQSLVEFAMILPVFVLLLMAMVDFGRGFYTWLEVTNAAREGARAGAVQLDSASIDAKIYASLCKTYPSDCALDPSSSVMHITKTNVQGARGQEVTINISYDFHYATPIGNILHLVSGGTLATPTITGHSSMRLE